MVFLDTKLSTRMTEKAWLSSIRLKIYPPILIFDEATSSVDNETELLLQKALYEISKDRTTIVIAHRLSTVIKSEKIYVIDEGKVVDEGNHESLISSSETYKKFYLKQFQND